jgi:DivIVA domain-containing protein
MDLSAVDVQQKTFRERFRGYDPDDVEDFLDRVVETLRGYEVKVRQQQEELEGLKSEIAGSKEAEEAIKRTYITAQRTSQEMINEAQQKADRILEKAGSEVEASQQQAKSETSRAVQAAKAEAEGIRKAAREEAEKSRRDAQGEQEALRHRIAQLRTTVSDIQGRMAEFAQNAAVELEAIGAAIDLEAESVQAVTGSTQPPPRPVDTREKPAPAKPEPAGKGQEGAGTEQAQDDPKTTARREAAYLQQPRGQRPWDNRGD